VLEPVVVSITSYQFLPAKIGGQKGIAFFNEYFSEHVKLTCITVQENANELAKGYETIRLFSSSRFRYINPLYFFRIRNIIKKKKATHLLIEHPYLGWLAFFLKKFTGIKTVVHSHNIESLRFKTLNKWWWKILWQYERWTHRNADYNFFIHSDDLAYATREFGLEKEKCLVVTYGISIKEPPSAEEQNAAAQFIRQKHAIAEEEKILLFSGSFNYQPNLDALKIIEEKLCPLWDSQGFKYKVVVCGPWLEPEFIQHPHIIIAGFVDSIEPYFTGADVFINPVMDGGGIKTKLVEALGYNCNAVSTIEGSTGIDIALTNNKLFLAENESWKMFAQKTIEASVLNATIPDGFYQHFYWGYSTKKAAEFIR
jgi:hypothetical protein